jgi:hypothetical protein
MFDWPDVSSITDILRADRDEILESLEELGEAYELRKQMAEDQHEPFEENMEDMFDEYIESLPADERAFARSLARK